MKRENPDGSERKHIIYKEEFRRQAVEMVIHSGKTQAQAHLGFDQASLAKIPDEKLEMCSPSCLTSRRGALT